MSRFTILPNKATAEDIEELGTDNSSTKVFLSSRFREQWNAIAKWRNENNRTPVDIMGCHIIEEDIIHKFTPLERRWHVLVSCVISSQTRDEQNFATMKKLRQTFGVPFDCALFNELTVEQLEESLYPISFYKTKAINLNKISKICMNEYGGDIPNEVSQLLKLPGCGHKISNLIMHSAWDKTVGIVVDVHVDRISQRLHWISKSKSPEDTMNKLHETIPCYLWNDVNLMLVGFGQSVCKANPRCDECPANNFCPSRQFKRKISTPQGNRKKNATPPKKKTAKDSKPSSPKTLMKEFSPVKLEKIKEERK